MGHAVSGLPSIANAAFCGLSGDPQGENTVALTGLTIGPGPVQRPNPSVNHTTAAAANTITPTSATSTAFRTRLRFGASRVALRAWLGPSPLRSDAGRDVDDRVRVEAVTVPDPADLDLVAVRELISDELSLYLNGDWRMPTGDRL